MPAWAQGTTQRVSVGATGAEGIGFSDDPALSADGRFVVFQSDASNLVPGDTNDEVDIFVRDRRADTTRRVSISSSGRQGHGYNYDPTMSPDGRFVAFASRAGDLVPGDTNGEADVFVRDRKLGTTARTSVGSAGVQGNDLSSAPALSAGGRFVAFLSIASNLVPGDTNGMGDVFVRDRKLGTTRRVSVSTGGVQGNGNSYFPVLSADARFVVFQSDASNLVRGDTNRTNDVFVRDRRAGTTELVSISSADVQGNESSSAPVVSADGRFVAFSSRATNLVPDVSDGARAAREPPGNRSNVFIRDRQKGTTRRISVSSAGVPGDDNSTAPAISADGRFVAFLSDASNLVPGDTNGVNDVFVRDRRTGTTRRVSVSSAGAQSNDYSDHPALSADGRLVAFRSGASNLVPSDTNGTWDVFIRIPAPGRAH